MDKPENTWTKIDVQHLVASEVKYYMEKDSISIQELAYHCEVSEANIRLLLSGKQFISSNLIARLCNFFKISPHQLFIRAKTNEESGIN